ncbi:MAG: cyclopropane-fatty-acyl-phospholipid synthase family protein [Xanthobacteraceae bacterium]|nr:cyclopropane-fatty-acyl-phospholipid synthase family protein [Xanthobacteraceae bacterium]
MSLARAAIHVGEAFAWPDALSSFVIDRLVDRTRRKLQAGSRDEDESFARAMRDFPIAINTAEANTQHYEIPAEFFGLALGPQRKYSCCLYDKGVNSLADAEEHALAATAENAQLQDGQDILELGCGWGSLSLWMAHRFPHSRVTSVSNSHSQRQYIMGAARERGLGNLAVVTADMNEYVPSSAFDRVISIEMFEHMINWRPLLERINRALRPGGSLFLHVFSHRAASYRFCPDDRDDWIAQHFFTGGIMPSHQLIRQFPDIFRVDQEWQWSGQHYARTARDWLANYDQNDSEIFDVLKRVYGNDARLWQRRWRLFFLATIGLFGHADGKEWGVSHYRLSPSH